MQNWTTAGLIAVTAATASATDFFVPVNLVPFANERLQARIPAVPSGAVVLGSVPFFIDPVLNNVWSADRATGPNPRVIEIPINLVGVKEVHTLINTSWGQPGPSSFTRIEFVGSGGAFFATDLVGGVDTRDWFDGSFTNTLTSPDSTQVFSVGRTRLDKQRIDLPPAFAGEDLVRIRVIDTGAAEVSRTLFQGLTLVVDQPGRRAWTCEFGGGGQAYQAFQAPEGITWAQADAQAQSLGGHLAVITSAAENDFVYSFVGGNQAFWASESNGNALGPWIGGVQPAGSPEPGGGWSWVTGEPFAFSAWALGEPNNSNGGIEDRLQFFGNAVPASNRWNDYPGGRNTVRGFIVEFPRCLADFNADGTPDFFDYLDYVAAYDVETCGADVNVDGIVDFFDYLDFALAFDAGC
ncbi:MAG: lectin-like protein [Planctomycetota bacterium]|nr:lectin-like protein [Planctomycetota bacterium]